MDMRRSFFIVSGVALIGAILWFAAYAVSRHLCVSHFAKSTDDLDWLRQEFRLNQQELDRIRALHDGYLPKCREMCEHIAARKAELKAALGDGLTVSPAAEAKLAEVARLRAECQTQMLRHFAEVARAMPPEQGRRYLAEMQRLTLGFHEQVEQSMSGSASPHGGHH
jgi:hypothetical protein